MLKILKEGQKLFLVFILLIIIISNGGCAPRSKEVIYPEHNIRIIASVPAGGGQDAQARIIQPHLQNILGVPVIVDNIPGAASRIGAAAAYKAKNDGYTLMLEIPIILLIGELVYEGDYKRMEFEEIYAWAVGTDVIATPKDSPIKSMDDLIAAMKNERLTYCHPGKGTIMQTKMAAWIEMYNLDFVGVPYEGTAPALGALLGKEVDFGVVTVPMAYDVKDELNIISVFFEERLPFFPDVPTIIEAGFADTMLLPYYYGLIAPPGLPKDIKNILEDAMEEVVLNTEIKEWVEENKFIYKPLNSTEYRQVVIEEYEIVEQIKHLIE